MHNEFHQRLGLELPLIQAPMAGVQDSALAIAVSNAGGLGSLPCAMLSIAQIGDELEAIVAATEKPYNVNFFCHRPPPADDPRETAWRQTLAPYYAEFGLDIEAIAGLYFDHRDPLSDQGIDPRQSILQQISFARRTGRRDGGDDAAARASNLFIARPFQPHLEFIGTVAAVHDMGVAIDQPWRHQPAS